MRMTVLNDSNLEPSALRANLREMYLKTLLVFIGVVLSSMGVGALTSPYHITDIQFKPGSPNRRLGSFTFSFVNLKAGKDKIITCDWRGATGGTRGNFVPNEWVSTTPVLGHGHRS